MSELPPEFGLLLGLLLVSISIWIRIALNRRNFYQKSVAHNIGYNSYTTSVLNKIIETGSSYISIIVGLYGGGITIFHIIELLWL